MKRILTILLVGLILNPCLGISQVTLDKTMSVGGKINDMVYRNGNLIVGTDAGFVDVFDARGGMLTQQIKLPNIDDFMSDPYTPSVLSVDALSGTDRFLLVSEAKGGTQTLFLHEKGQLQPLMKEVPLKIKKARFVGDNLILLGLVSNDLILYDYIQEKEMYRVSINPFPLTDFALFDDAGLQQVAVSCESGEVFIVDLLSGALIGSFSTGNSDRHPIIDCRNGKILVGDHSQQVILHDLSKNSSDLFITESPVYAVGISPLGTKAAFTQNSSGDVSILDLRLNRIIATIPGQNSTVKNLLFLDEKSLVNSADNKLLNLWKIAP